MSNSSLTTLTTSQDDIATDNNTIEPLDNPAISASNALPTKPDIDALLDSADELPVTWIKEQSQLTPVIEALKSC